MGRGKPGTAESRILETLCAHPLFREVPTDDLRGLIRDGVWRIWPTGHFLFLAGDPAEGLYMLLEGYVKITQTDAAGQEVVVQMVGPGEPLGLIALFADQPYPASAQTMTPCQTLWIPAAAFREFLLRHPGVALRLLRLLAERLHEAHRRLLEVSVLRVERRLARVLVRLAARLGRRTEEGIELVLPLSREELAELCGTRLHTVSRLLNRWQRAGWVRLGRRRIVLREPHALVALAEELEPLSLSGRKVGSKEGCRS
ncbi:Crp/Fnr family transcriptional regulator [Thermoflexus sp.]|uniref:Crp/Fnr family transcriptional regulator n=1 Tax=Thermoflexus sp. TaxID=1969742 RepID=UPI0035E44D48